MKTKQNNLLFATLAAAVLFGVNVSYAGETAFESLKASVSPSVLSGMVLQDVPKGYAAGNVSITPAMAELPLRALQPVPALFNADKNFLGGLFGQKDPVLKYEFEYDTAGMPAGTARDLTIVLPEDLKGKGYRFIGREFYICDGFDMEVEDERLSPASFYIKLVKPADGNTFSGRTIHRLVVTLRAAKKLPENPVLDAPMKLYFDYDPYISAFHLGWKGIPKEASSRIIIVNASGTRLYQIISYWDSIEDYPEQHSWVFDKDLEFFSKFNLSGDEEITVSISQSDGTGRYSPPAVIKTTLNNLKKLRGSSV